MFTHAAFRLFDTTYPAYRVFMLLTVIAMFAALLAVLTRTRVGLIIQAALTRPDMVAMLGHNVRKIFMPVFGAGALAVEIRKFRMPIVQGRPAG
jgi:branched-chain amino acid transport system permease protein